MIAIAPLNGVVPLPGISRSIGGRGAVGDLPGLGSSSAQPKLTGSGLRILRRSVGPDLVAEQPPINESRWAEDAHSTQHRRRLGGRKCLFATSLASHHGGGQDSSSNTRLKWAECPHDARNPRTFPIFHILMPFSLGADRRTTLLPLFSSQARY